MGVQSFPGSKILKQMEKCYSNFPGCKIPCHREVWVIDDVSREKINWKTNWTSELFIEAATANVEV